MKKQVQKFGEFVKRESVSESFDIGEKPLGLASWEIGDYTSVVKYGGNEISIGDWDGDYDDSGNFIGMRRVLRAARKIGAPDATAVWSVEDGMIVTAGPGGIMIPARIK